MKVFVSGAAGFIGSHVVSELSRRGHEVTGLVHDEKEGKTVKSAGGRYVVGDLMESGPWCEEIKKADKVISLTKPFKTEDDIKLDQVEGLGRMHTEAVTNLIKAAAEGNAKAVIVTHDTMCFGDRKGKWVSDTDAIDPIGYCKPLTGSFDAINRVGEDAGIPLIQVYPSLVYGNGGCFAHLIEDFKSGKASVVEPGDNYLSIIHVEDVAVYYALAIEKLDRNESFCLADDRPVKQRVLMDHIADLLDLPSPKMVNFKSFAKQNGILAAESISSSTRVQGVKAMDLLGYVPKFRSYESGIRETLKSMGIEPRKRELEEAA